MVASEIRLDVTKGTLRDHSVRWFVEAYKAVNKPDLIKKAFVLCKAASTLFEIFHARILTCGSVSSTTATTRSNNDSVDAEVFLPEDDVVESDGVEDEAPLEVVLEHIMSDKTYVPEGYIMGTDGSLIVDGAADKHCDKNTREPDVTLLGSVRGVGDAVTNLRLNAYSSLHTPENIKQFAFFRILRCSLSSTIRAVQEYYICDASYTGIKFTKGFIKD
ncbi:hypothetical protein DFH29DRAFT_881980 [Suillus ampliporus]|nr:hypothetical protein DFH29DRAFT_881980 [Suillus ampliporus]